jgi:hypothetical protein
VLCSVRTATTDVVSVDEQAFEKADEAAVDEDGFECQMPRCTINREAHHERWDRDLNVHHIMPLGTFIDADGVLDYKRSNRLENLITLCQRNGGPEV